MLANRYRLETHDPLPANPNLAFQLFVVDFKNAAATLKLNEEQIRDMKRLFSQASSEINSKIAKLPGSDSLDFDKMIQSKEFGRLDFQQQRILLRYRSDIQSQFSDILSDFQRQQTTNLQVGSGLPVILLESPMRRFIGVTDQQAEEIKERSLALSNRFDVIVRKLRKTATEIVRTELSEEQWQKLSDYIGASELQRYPAAYPETQLRHLIYQYDFNVDSSAMQSYQVRKDMPRWLNRMRQASGGEL